MEINDKIHCFFEQSGTFKNEFKKLGYEAYDYDIQNEFGETNRQIDLFNEIELCFDYLAVGRKAGEITLFTYIKPDDLIIAFFPCIYFNQYSQLAFTFNCFNYRSLCEDKKINAILEREKKRSYYYRVLLKFVYIAYKLDLRLIIENPATPPHYLRCNFVKEPDIVDNNRLLRGDYFKKPTAYWFFNCEPTQGLFSYQKDKKPETRGIIVFASDIVDGKILNAAAVVKVNHGLLASSGLCFSILNALKRANGLRPLLKTALSIYEDGKLSDNMEDKNRQS